MDSESSLQPCSTFAACDSLMPEGTKRLLLIGASDSVNGIMASFIILNVQLLSFRNSVDSFLYHQPSSEEKQYLHLKKNKKKNKSAH